MSRHTRLIPAATLAFLLGALAGCGGDDDEPAPAPAVHTAANGDVFNDADAEFAADLLQHHALALVLVDLTREADVSPDLQAVADEVLAVHGPEIETLTGWLGDWDLPVPETIRDHANAHAEERGEIVEIPGGDLPGMPDHADVEALEGLEGQAFEQQWLELMIAHHEGAIVLAEEQVESGRFAAAVDLATAVVDTQQAQVERMRALLAE